MGSGMWNSSTPSFGARSAPLRGARGLSFDVDGTLYRVRRLRGRGASVETGGWLWR